MLEWAPYGTVQGAITHVGQCDVERKFLSTTLEIPVMVAKLGATNTNINFLFVAIKIIIFIV